MITRNETARNLSLAAEVAALFAVLVLGIAYLKLQRLSGLKKTRETVSESLGMLGFEGQQPDGQQPEITAPKTG